MQEGMLTCGALSDHMQQVRLHKRQVNDNHGTAAKETEAESVLKRAAKNLLVVSTLMLAGESNQVRQRATLAVMTPLEKWHGTQNAFLRKTTATLPWLVAQLRGEFWDPLIAICRVLRSPGNLRHIGFAVGRGDWLGSDPGSSFDDDYAENLGSLALAALGCRMRRCLWMLKGWDCRPDCAHALELRIPLACRLPPANLDILPYSH